MRPYNADEYSYPQSVEPQIADRLEGVYSPYTCEMFGELTETDIEHIVVRSETHDSGLCSASPERKREFARDIRNLTLSAPHLNRNLKGANAVPECLIASSTILRILLSDIRLAPVAGCSSPSF